MKCLFFHYIFLFYFSLLYFLLFCFYIFFCTSWKKNMWQRKRHTINGNIVSIWKVLLWPWGGTINIQTDVSWLRTRVILTLYEWFSQSFIESDPFMLHISWTRVSSFELDVPSIFLKSHLLYISTMPVFCFWTRCCHFYFYF